METNIGMNAPAVAAPEGSQSPQQSAQTPNPDTGTKEVALAAQPTGETEKHEPTTEERRYYADQKRQQREADHRREIEATTARYNRDAQSLGFKDHADMIAQLAVKSFNEKLQSGEPLTPETVGALVQTFSRREAQIEQRFADEAGTQAASRDLAQEFAAFQANPDYADAGIKSIPDFVKQPWYGDFYHLVSALGWSLSDAYEAVNRAPLAKKRAEAARQAALNSVGSKNHMKPADGGADELGGVSVPADVMEWYREMNPKWTTKQIQEDYGKFLKNTQSAK